jgi:8-oxo-dGTP pyrophosphatase MutT (NUDIX family)
MSELHGKAADIGRFRLALAPGLRLAIARWRVEPGETMAEALARELVEEGNIEIS